MKSLLSGFTGNVPFREIQRKVYHQTVMVERLSSVLKPPLSVSNPIVDWLLFSGYW